MKQFTEHALFEGARLINVQSNRFKTSRITVRFAINLSEDTVAAFAAVPGLLRYTSAKYPTNMQTERKLAALYGAGFSASAGTFGDVQILSFTMSVIDDKFALDGESIREQALSFLLDSLLYPDLEDGLMKVENLQREKRLMAEEIKAEQNDKMLFSFNRFQKHFYEGEAAAIRTELENVERLTVQAVTDAWRTMLSGAEIFVCSVGNLPPEPTIRAFQAAFSAIKRKYRKPVMLAHKASETVKTVIETEPLEQCKLNLGFSCASDNTQAGKVFNALFGGNEMALLSKVVREKMSLCYYCSSAFGNKKKVVLVYSGIEADNRQKAVEAICAQLKVIQNGEITKEQLATAKRKLKEAYSGFDAPMDIARWYLSQMFDEEILTPEAAYQKIENISLEQVKAFAATVRLDTVYSLGEK